jgi:anti-sigma regulatory factor (Ser/Thr protein kinase)/ABC-type transporter Mla MlaB component
MCREMLELLTRATGYADDITVLAAQRVPLPDAVTIDVQARPTVLREIREALSAWLAPFGARDNDVAAIQHVVGECVTNVVVHAYRDRPEAAERPVRVVASFDDTGALTMSIADQGSWRYGHRSDGGRGMQVVSNMCDWVSIDRRPHGTTVTLTCPFTRTVTLMDQDVALTGSRQHEEAFDLDEREGVLVVRGPVDIVSAEELRLALLRLLNGRAEEVRVELDEVTILASAGVQVLFEALERAHAQGITLGLDASAGCPAQHVLTLVRLPYDPTATR